MNLLNHLNLNYLRIFLVVFRTRSMTQAAKELHLTQSGVSQQIKSLEETLNITLFDRINRRIIPTSEAEILYRECSRRLEDLEKALQVISYRDHEPRGKIRIGMPSCYGNRVLLSSLASFVEQHHHISIELQTAIASQTHTMLLEGQLDFLLTDTPASAEPISQDLVWKEELVLVCHSQIMEGLGPFSFSYGYLSKLPFVIHVDHRETLNAWFEQAFDKSGSFLKIRAAVSDPEAAATLAQSKVGATLLTKPLAHQLMARDKEIKAIEAPKDMFCKIYLCRLKKRTTASAVQFCYDWLLSHLETLDHSAQANL